MCGSHSPVVHDPLQDPLTLLNWVHNGGHSEQYIKPYDLHPHLHFKRTPGILCTFYQVCMTEDPFASKNDMNSLDITFCNYVKHKVNSKVERLQDPNSLVIIDPFPRNSRYNFNIPRFSPGQKFRSCEECLQNMVTDSGSTGDDVKEDSKHIW